MQTTAANDVPLTPVSFLQRAADVFPDAPAITDPDVVGAGRSSSYAEFRVGADRIAGAIRGYGIGKGERVAVLSRNNPEMIQMHFGIPGAGAVLVPLNVRLAPQEYRFILDHSKASVLFVDAALTPRIEPVRKELSVERIVVLPTPEKIDTGPYADTLLPPWLDEYDDGLGMQLPDDERDAVAVNYTSGTTGSPKGAVYTHRGAYLNALGQALELRLGPEDVYLWTLPMFHCDGWCYTWAVTAVGARHVCLRDFDTGRALELMVEERVTRFCGAPVILNSLAEEDPASRPTLDRTVIGATGGAPPAPATIEAMRDVGIQVVHLYGLTETYGPSMICEEQSGWRDLPLQEYAERISRQGVRTINVEGTRVVDEDMNDVPRDATTIGEIVIRSNSVMAGYLNDQEATREAFAGGWLHTGDLAVMPPDGYVEIRDRMKDIIISGGENVSSIEVENVLMAHPAVSEAAVVSAPHGRWGEVPVAFVSLRPGVEESEDELIEHVRERLAHFKAPKAITFGELPKTSTGKIQKYELRSRVPEDLD